MKPIGTVQRALLSVYHKTNLINLAQFLVKHGVELIASTGTGACLREANLPFKQVAEITGSPEILGGRVKTLHPKIHGAILADRRSPQHLAELTSHNILAIDLVVTDLYPFEEVLKRGGTTEELIENIDIGGPTLVRAAAKNALGGVTIITDPNDYELIYQSLASNNIVIAEAHRRDLAAKAFRMVADYDAAIATWFTTPNTQAAKSQESLRYGENAHQTGTLYRDSRTPHGIAHGKLLQGKQLSYNNYLDMDAAWRTVGLLGEGGCCIVKHTNPCGAAVHADQSAAFLHALSGDPMAAFGGVVGFSAPVTASTANTILQSKLFIECMVAPAFDEAALALLSRKTDLRLLCATQATDNKMECRSISGGMLLQTPDSGPSDASTWECVTQKKLQPELLNELQFLLCVVAMMRSNAIAIGRDKVLFGAGTGCVSRIDAVHLALKKAGEKTKGALLASDAFFPFADSIVAAGQAGISVIVQPGGSKRDQECIDAANEHNITMLFTHRRHFRH